MHIHINALGQVHEFRKTLTVGVLAVTAAATLTLGAALPTNAPPDNGDYKNSVVMIPAGTPVGMYITVAYTYDRSPAGALRISWGTFSAPVGFDLVRVHRFLDRIDELVPPGVTFNHDDTSYGAAMSSPRRHAREAEPA